MRINNPEIFYCYQPVAVVNETRVKADKARRVYPPPHVLARHAKAGTRCM